MKSNPSSNQRQGKPKGKTAPKQSMGKGPRQEAPAAAATKRYSNKPIESPLPGGGRSVKFCEYVQDISGSVAFSATSFSVQPGLAQMFAWLANQASSYQEYRFRMLKFRYETEKSSASSGKLMMAFQQDAADPIPINKQEMLENQYKAKCAVWQEIEFSVPVNEALGRTRYVRTSALSANLDIKTYDLGNLIVATNGCADATAIGELYIEYVIELVTPVLNILSIASSTSKVLAGATPSQTSFLGTTPVATGGLDVTATGNVITFNRVGRYLVDISVAGTAMFSSFVPVTAASTAAVSLALNGFGNLAANAGTVAIASYFVVVSNRGETLSVVCTTQCTTLTASTTKIASFGIA